MPREVSDIASSPMPARRTLPDGPSAPVSVIWAEILYVPPMNMRGHNISHTPFAVPMTSAIPSWNDQQFGERSVAEVAPLKPSNSTISSFKPPLTSQPSPTPSLSLSAFWAAVPNGGHGSH